MATWQKVVLSVLEAVAVLLVAKLWFRQPKLGIGARLLWSAVLLVPLLGIAVYMACFAEPDEELFDTYTAKELGDIGDNGKDSHHE